MTHPLFLVDSFTARPFGGNPAAVVLLGEDEDPPEDWLRAVAREMNHSETAFVAPRDDGSYDLRWFTPETEARLCGHATLATAHVLWATGRTDAGRLVFHTLSGELVCVRRGEGIAMDFPASLAEPDRAPDGLLAALGLDHCKAVLRSRTDFVIELSSAEGVAALRPDFAALRRVETRAVIVTAASRETSVDFVSRFFAPAVGVDEDPVTGSAHCILAPLWAARLGRHELRARQLSARGGTLGLRVAGDRVELEGTAVLVVEGTLRA